ncbi:MAG TPA: choice-of-anchor tandem repeat GloVer-containing protein [Terriglobia bacterium]|nr:choice-of-anchor tandem repeat GloVer-containing protein [Terriglobia bacterium]
MIVPTIVMMLAAVAAPAQSYTVLYDFPIYNGSQPFEPLSGFVADAAGNLYGTTPYGGTTDNGTVYELTAPYYSSATVLYSFKGGNDGSEPYAALIRDASGTFYGTTQGGGGLGNCLGNCGTVFAVNSNKERVLYAFTGGADGAEPTAGLVRDSAGNFYGTAAAGGIANGCGGYGCGVVFKLDRTGNETVLHTFTGGADGGGPYAGLARDQAGNLYGTTEWGGSLGNTCFALVTGCGVVFKLDPSGNETVLYTFTGGADGGGPGGGTLLLDATGNLYGTAQQGGNTSSCTYSFGCGVVYEVTPGGVETVLYSFSGGTDGRMPYAGLVRDGKGNLYGTTNNGGSTNNGNGFCAEVDGCGVIFRLTPAGTETVLHAFDATDGYLCEGALLYHSGFLYGATYAGGTEGYGLTFKLQP